MSDQSNGLRVFNACDGGNFPGVRSAGAAARLKKQRENETFF
jgi:hypothetical protein